VDWLTSGGAISGVNCEMLVLDVFSISQWAFTDGK